MRRKIKTKTSAGKLKADAWEWCSLYIRLRDAVEYWRANPHMPFGMVKCCTCDRIIPWRHTKGQRGKAQCDAGHFLRRGLGGSSGVYFDERNIHAQCKRCNAWDDEMEKRYLDFMLQKYGEKVVDLLKFLHKNRSYKGQLHQVRFLYMDKYETLKEELINEGIVL